jgi:3-hydroxymyristoyl/3-hydroxydecanoyl-(acyl carrier protein) dehydratase
MVDRITRFEPWAAIEGRKAVSFEEYSLLKPFGRNGSFPESLLLECCVESARWLVTASSGFTQTSILSEVREFRIEREVGMGDSLEIVAHVQQRGEDDLRVECRVACSRGNVAYGDVIVALGPLNESFDREWVEGYWRELYGAA